MATDDKPAWVQAHEALSRLAVRRAELDCEEAGWLLAGLRTRVWEPLGFASYLEYLGRTFGYAPRLAAERLRTARVLEELPRTTAALRDGALCWSAVRELTRVATPDTEADWIKAGGNRSIREIESLVAGRERGSRPTDPPDPQARRHLLRLDLSADAYALFREARAELERRSGGHLEDTDVIAEMARAVLGSPGDEGRASYQINLTMCERCGAGTQDGSGEIVPIPPEAVELAYCDAQVLDPGKPAFQTIPPAVRRAVMRRDHGCCSVPGCSQALWVDVHHVRLLSEGGDHDPEYLTVLCTAHHRALHDGRLFIEGQASTGFRFLHADGAPYGAVRSPEVAGVAADVFSALKNLGFKEKVARRAVEAARAECGEDDPSFDALVRAALAAARRPPPESHVGHGLLADAVSGLTNLGFKAKAARQAVEACHREAGGDGLALETLIVKALALLRRPGLVTTYHPSGRT